MDENAPLITEIRNDIIYGVLANGEVAQLVEHHVRNVGVESSNLFFSTISKIRFIALNDETFFVFRSLEFTHFLNAKVHFTLINKG